MFIGYIRMSKADGSQTNDLQRDALIAAGVDAAHFYEDRASGKREERPGLTGLSESTTTRRHAGRMEAGPPRS
uniref:Resolvase/invertase-type recombinase catalytic domain-containing protein n=1 Tax=Klebsiella pneumoniae TaxID=573 RepID=A0A809SV24_KLEPN|nr:hypothetical protein [Klebsiella pneumoniae]